MDSAQQIYVTNYYHYKIVHTIELQIKLVFEK